MLFRVPKRTTQIMRGYCVAGYTVCIEQVSVIHLTPIISVYHWMAHIVGQCFYNASTCIIDEPGRSALKAWRHEKEPMYIIIVTQQGDSQVLVNSIPNCIPGFANTMSPPLINGFLSLTV